MRFFALAVVFFANGCSNSTPAETPVPEGEEITYNEAELKKQRYYLFNLSRKTN